MTDPKQGYWAQMPTLMKICAPLTVVLFICGAVLMTWGYPLGIVLIGTPVLIIGIRLVLLNLLDIGPRTIVGYTYDYWTTRVETSFNLPAGLISGALIVLILLTGFILKFTPAGNGLF